LENKSPFQNTFTSSVVIYLTKLNHANATPGWNSSKVSKYPILLLGGRVGEYNQKKKGQKIK